MKKLLFAIISALTLIGFTSCNQEPSQATLIGRWEMISQEWDGQASSDFDSATPVFEFLQDNQFNLWLYGERDDAPYRTATWFQEGNVLTLSEEIIFIGTGDPMTIQTLSSSTLVLSCVHVVPPIENPATGDISDPRNIQIKYTFKRLK